MEQVGVSVILTTYNWPEALDRVLSSLSQQQYKKFEVIIADDGSKDATAQLIRDWQQKNKIHMIHCWHPDEGFRAAMIRNRAVAIANYDYLIFLDGDCVVKQDFIANHVKLAQMGWFVSGNRILLSESFTKIVLNQKMNIENYSKWQWFIAALKGNSNRFLPMLNIPLGVFRKTAANRWEGAKTCNLGLWRQDYILVNGLDENFVGWGFEDSDLIVRLQRANIKRKSGKFATTVLHLWHKEQNRNSVKENACRLTQTLQSKEIKAKKGFDQYAGNKI